MIVTAVFRINATREFDNSSGITRLLSTLNLKVHATGKQI